jgi:diaminopimelate epimerase
MKFVKIHGLGNDYIYVNCLEEEVDEPEELAKQLSNRHFGVGSDGLILVMPSDKADFRMRIFNVDGSEAEMCGNGIRGFAKYVYDYGLSKKKLRIETLAGIINLEIIKTENNKVSLVKVDMGEPILEREKIPMLGKPGRVINERLKLKDRLVRGTCVSMGNPHCVIFVNNLKLDIKEIGSRIEHADSFPRRTNVEFVQVLKKEEIKMRVWERGVGETLACGTGACAAVVASVLNRKTGRNVTVHLKGGELKIEWSEEDNHVYMTGPAEYVFRGEI